MYSVNASPEIVKKMQVHRDAKVRCWRCGKVWRLIDLPPKLFIETDMKKFRAPDKGGNGYNYDCPHCKALIYAPRW